MKRLTSWLPPALWMGLLFLLSAIPGKSLPHVDLSFADKIVHACVYAPLGAAFFRAIDVSRPGLRWKAVGMAVALTGVFGVSDELHQMFVPLRAPDLRDLVADLFGGTLGAFSWAWVRARRWSDAPLGGGAGVSDPSA